ncbi:major facilitator superfamily domain-containing protein [Aspergillus cavernicola]|uniref:Major facilitator superfamily domain-containing protein n=1 Tax=Aspergillus cavernicola TaxID=176166 RepID=A0ABR4IYB7_9EURO
MVSQRAMFTASRIQTFTYLLGVCPFSIAFLVFINSSISFVVTDLIGLHDGEGDAVGTLGFADELLALAACPLWGVLSDRIGVRQVCTAGYIIIAIALVLFVQAKNVYPQLLLGRLLFSIGGAAVSTMVTAVLPVVTGRNPNRQIEEDGAESRTNAPSSRLAGFVGMSAGCGALISLLVLLPLPAHFQQLGISPVKAIQYSYYTVSVVALLVSVGCFIGLRGLPGEDGKAWTSLWTASQPEIRPIEPSSKSSYFTSFKTRFPYLNQFGSAITLGFRNRDILIGYLGGFVARASSVGISLFIPLFVNNYYRMSDLCDEQPMERTHPGAIKRSCPKAYVLASILTGVSQLVALIAAPAFGYLSERSRRYHLPLLVACLAGVVGYLVLALLRSPEFRGENGSPGIFVVMALIGVSQIGAIVCSLSVLSNGILSMTDPVGIDIATTDTDDEQGPTTARESDEQQPLLDTPATIGEQQQPSDLKGSIAGVYSLFGGAGILLLTKLGGLLFDALSSSAPFYIMAGFNGVLVIVGIVSGLVIRLRASQWRLSVAP